MKLTIRLRYQTQPCQTLFLCGDHPWFGGGQPERALPLRYVDDGCWEVALDLSDTLRPKIPVSYFFLLRDADGSVTEDFGADRKLDLVALGSGHTIMIE